MLWIKFCLYLCLCRDGRVYWNERILGETMCIYLAWRGVRQSWSLKWDGRNNEIPLTIGTILQHQQNYGVPLYHCITVWLYERETETLPGCFVPLFGQTELWITVSKVKQKLSMREEKGRREGLCDWLAGINKEKQCWEPQVALVSSGQSRCSHQHYWLLTIQHCLPRAWPPSLFRQLKHSLSVGEGLSLWSVIIVSCPWTCDNNTGRRSEGVFNQYAGLTFPRG